MKRKKIAFNSDTVYVAVIYILCILMALLWLYPIVYAISASLSDPNEILLGNVLLLPKNFTLQAYQFILKNKNLLTGYKNTLIYTVVGTAWNMLLTTCAAYPLSKKDLQGRTTMTMLITFTMFFGGGMIPTYLNLRNLGLLNTRWVMIIPSAVNATNFLIMRNYFVYSVSEELQDAAYVEGASQLQILGRVVLPLSHSILGVLTIYYATGHWNAYFNALIYLTDDNLMPLQIFLRRILILGSMEDMGTGSFVSDALLYESLKYGIVVVAAVPMVIAYLLVQKSFKKGIMMGALKG